jgi:hypothetical protein
LPETVARTIQFESAIDKIWRPIIHPAGQKNISSIYI